MCGVAAAVGPGAAGLVDQMVGRLAYRGVRSRVEYGAGWAVGHVRLPVVGVGVEYDQPVVRWQWVLAWAGEVLDFRDRSPGAGCDTGLVVDRWCTGGLWSGFGDLDGFWAVLAYDAGNGLLYCLTDYLCQRPLYVRYEPDLGWSAVASEPDAVASLAPVRLDPLYLSDVAKWGYCPDTSCTPYLTVRKMLPGELAVLSATAPPRYEVVDRLAPAAGTPDDLGREVVDAVRRRATSTDVEVAALVSGGLDSALTYTLARRYADVAAYYADDPNSPEWDRCRSVAPDATRLTWGAVTPARAVDYMQEPVDLGSLRPQVALSDAVAGRQVVCLTGDGADELFGGYARAARYDSQASDVWRELVGWHLPRLDRVMGRNRVEVRSPFLARRVAALALGLPRDLRTGKRVLRDLFRGDLPPGVADAPKVPLRAGDVAADREAWSVMMIDLFLRRVGPWLAR